MQRERGLAMACVKNECSCDEEMKLQVSPNALPSNFVLSGLHAGRNIFANLGIHGIRLGPGLVKGHHKVVEEVWVVPVATGCHCVVAKGCDELGAWQTVRCKGQR